MVFDLPGGVWDEDGVLHREVELRKLSGKEEELLSQQNASPAALVTLIISQCVLRIGAIAPVTADIARQLLIADRQAILLKLRAFSYGDRVQGTIRCPWTNCGAKVDIDFLISSIPVHPKMGLQQTVVASLPEDEQEDEAHPGQQFTFRLPNGGDQEALGGLLAHDPAGALVQLFERCIIPDDGDMSVTEIVRTLSVKARWILERVMQQEAPDLDLKMETACPECGRGFATPFDVQDFFFGELRASLDLLYRQVHYLAYHYHWSETEIMAMTKEKRMAYIEILADEMEALNHG